MINNVELSQGRKVYIGMKHSRCKSKTIALKQTNRINLRGNKK